MSKNIDVNKLIAELRWQEHELELSIQSQGDYGQSCQIIAYENIISLITSLQQEQPIDKNILTWRDVNEIERIINRVHYEFPHGIGEEAFGKLVLERFIDGKDDLQEQPNDVCAEIKEYYGKELPFEDERTKAAYHFFSAGKAFELKEYEEERKRHITSLLDNAKKGMNAGYKKAISELKEGKVECSPAMKEFINKFFELGNTYNFGFGPKTIQQEQPEVDLEKFTEKMDDWKARYNHPDNIPIKATMAFTARMFYQYPNVARLWYVQLPKATMDNARKEE